MNKISFQSALQEIKDFQYRTVVDVLIIVFIGIVVIRLLRILLTRTLLKKSDQQNKMLMIKLINYSGFTIILITVLAELGIKLSALLGAAGILGIAFGVASQKSLGNIISGFFMITEKSFEIGDVVTVGDKTGIVYSVELLSIMLKTFDNLLIRIPHETLISTNIVNITRFPIRRMDLFVTVSYQDDLKIVMDILRNTSHNNLYCLDEPNPFILIKEYKDSGVEIQFGVWFEKNDYIVTRNSVMTDILKNFKETGITIPYPHITIKTDEIPLKDSIS